ncbi:MAG: ECF transporter S component [Clostridiaceae bacterium]|jgi:uncharacterized membrane protein|nr:ECF transporter S component [Clostridiaceae bacterium]
MNNEVNKSKFSVRKIAVTGILSALSIALNFTPLAFMLVPGLPVQITFMHIPVIIGAIVEGPFAGAFIGMVFGLTSLYTAVQQSALPIAFAFLNPLVSILPRILIGIVAHYVYKGLNSIFKEKKQAVSIGITAAAATLTNTIGVLGMIYILYARRYVEALISSLGLPADTTPVYIFVSALPNFIAELVSSILICVPVVLAVKKIRK